MSKSPNLHSTFFKSLTPSTQSAKAWQGFRFEFGGKWNGCLGMLRPIPWVRPRSSQGTLVGACAQEVTTSAPATQGWGGGWEVLPDDKVPSMDPHCLEDEFIGLAGAIESPPSLQPPFPLFPVLLWQRSFLTNRDQCFSPECSHSGKWLLARNHIAQCI